MNNREKAELVFSEELEYIKSTAIKSFTLKCFEELTPDYFWDFTASSSQKHHPKVSNKQHGIVIHTKLCVWWGRKLTESFKVENLDAVISSLLLHDLQKFGKVLDHTNKPTLAEYWGSHGPMLSSQIENLYKDLKMNDDVKAHINAITICIALHMGIWTNDSLAVKWSQGITASKYEYINDISHIVHLADYCASRQCDKKMQELDNYKFPKV